MAEESATEESTTQGACGDVSMLDAASVEAVPARRRQCAPLLAIKQLVANGALTILVVSRDGVVLHQQSSR
jgi:hypothetical protein